MKRFLALILVLSFAVGLVGCGEKKAAPKKDAGTAAPKMDEKKTETPAPPAK